MQRRQWRSRFFASFYFCRVHGSQPEIGGGNFLIQTEITKVFASHCRWYFHNVVLTDGLDEDGSQALGQLRVVISGSGEFGLTDFYDRRAILRNPSGDGDTLREPFDCRQQLLPDLFSVSTNG